MNSQQERIKYAAEVFKEAQAELNLIEEARREKKLNMFIFGLTTLTFVSVIADVINTVDFAQKLLPDSFERLTALISPMALVLLLILFFLKGRR